MFSLVWGLWATGFGWVVATDFRGAAHRIHQASWRTPYTGVRFVRIVAGAFALAGPAVLLNGLYDLSSGQFGTDRLPQQPMPFIAATAVTGALGLWSLWRRSGMLRTAWADGPAPRRAAAAVITFAFVGFLVALWAGHPVAMLASWLAGGIAGLIVLVCAAPEERG
ncbi:hypothetical protein [Streptomyces sp. NPDC056452]|uniref:hypothetical protein n=1 Tax=Streptomyces sp. NPDC056452 TaxID=3345821 RepID=UPI003686CDE9